MKLSKSLTRREMLRRTAFAGAGLLAAPMINRGRFRLFGNDSAEYSRKATDLVRESTVIDMLSVLTLDLFGQLVGQNKFSVFSESETELFLKM